MVGNDETGVTETGSVLWHVYFAPLYRLMNLGSHDTSMGTTCILGRALN